VPVRIARRAAGPDDRLRQVGCPTSRLANHVFFRRPRPPEGGSREGSVGRRTPPYLRPRGRDGRRISGEHARETYLGLVLVEWNRINVRRSRISSARSSRHNQTGDEKARPFPTGVPCSPSPWPGSHPAGVLNAVKGSTEYPAPRSRIGSEFPFHAWPRHEKLVALTPAVGPCGDYGQVTGDAASIGIVEGGEWPGGEAAPRLYPTVERFPPPDTRSVLPRPKPTSSSQGFAPAQERFRLPRAASQGA